jgi:nucleoid-associated protein YgaU
MTLGARAESHVVRASRLLIALGVLLAGVCAAWPFRQSAIRLPQPPVAAIALDVSLRGRDVMLEPAPPGETSPAVGLASPSPAGFIPTESIPSAPESGPPVQTVSAVLTRPDLASLAPPPAMPAEFATIEPAHAPSIPRPAPRTYRLRDGDTLEWVAERFLGNPQRWEELYAANRDVLTRSDLLPVGATIKLPPREDQR